MRFFVHSYKMLLALFYVMCFPEKFIKPWRLRMIYRVNLIKRKTIKITKMPRRIDENRYNGLRNVMK